MATGCFRDGVSLRTVPPLRCWTDQKKHVHARVLLSKGPFFSVCAYSNVANNHLPYGWRPSDSHCRSSRIPDTRFEDSERHSSNAAGLRLGCGCASILSARVPPSIDALKCKLAVVNSPLHSLTRRDPSCPLAQKRNAVYLRWNLPASPKRVMSLVTV